jgi:hypothetical protein
LSATIDPLPSDIPLSTNAVSIRTSSTPCVRARAASAAGMVAALSAVRASTVPAA